jgi:hypothetical protein
MMTDYATKLRKSRSHEEDFAIHQAEAERIGREEGSPIEALLRLVDALTALKAHLDRVPWRDRESKEIASG